MSSGISSVGRWCGVDVKTFSIGFGRELFGFNDRHGTRWRFALIPLGGYVKFSGDADAASTPDDAGVEQMTPQERARTFPAQSIGERAAIVAAGPIANFLLAILIFAGTAFFFGKQVLMPRVDAAWSRQRCRARRAPGRRRRHLHRRADGGVLPPTCSASSSTRPEKPSPSRSIAAAVEVTLSVVPALSEMKTPVGTQRSSG